MKRQLQQSFEEYQAAVQRPVDLFAALKYDLVMNKWSLVLAANWINYDNLEHEFNRMIAIMQRILSPEEMNTIARLGVFNSTEYLPKLLLDRYRTGIQFNDEERMNGIVMYEGLIIQAEKHEPVAAVTS